MTNKWLRTFLMFVLCAFAITPTWSQRRTDTGNLNPNHSKDQGLRSFDLRSQTASRAAAAQSRSTAVVQRRTASVRAFVTAERATGRSTRITLNRHGMPKLYFRENGLLSAPDDGGPEDIAKAFLRRHSSVFAFTAEEVEGLRTTFKDVGDSATHLAFQQTVNGIDLFEGQVKFTMTKAGEVVQVAGGEFSPGIAVTGAQKLTADEAGEAAKAFAKAGATGSLMRAPELSVFPVDASTGRLSYRVFVEAASGNSYEILVDAENGALLYRRNITVYSGRGTVWTASPLEGARQEVAFPDSWLPVVSNITTGNNADALLGSKGEYSASSINSATIASGRAFSPSQTFNFPFGDGTLGMNPKDYPAAAVTNLFYFINAAHDYYYGLGFTESAGNFQTDNFGKGGSGGDAVRAFAQYSGLENNASFTATPDGTAPVMRMGIYTRGTANQFDDLDTAYSGQVTFHEYGHGVSSRLVGGGATTSCLFGLQSAALAEGWSDYFAVSYFNSPVVGAYGATNSLIGMRRQSYEGYTYTYEDLGNAGYEVHKDGEIWAATLWDIRQALGKDIADRLVVDGLKATPCNPSMTDARDAILAADQAANAGANRTKLWTAFAKHGMGYSARGVDGDESTGQLYDAAYDLPGDLQSSGNPAITSNPLLTSASAASAYNYTVTASNPNGGALNYELTSGPAGMTVDAASGGIQWNTSFTTQRVKITVTDGKGGKVVHGYMVPILTHLEVGSPITIAGNEKSIGFGYLDIPAGIPVFQMTLRNGTGDTDLWVADPDGWDYYSERDGLNETLSFANPKPGRWYVGVYGYKAYAQVSLTAAAITPELLPASASKAGLAGVTGSETLYRITVPSNTSSLAIASSGGVGDLDIYLEMGSPALCQLSGSVSSGCWYTYASATDESNNESIVVQAPAPGDWYIDLSAYGEYAGVTFTATVTTIGLGMSPAALMFSAQPSGSAPPSQNLTLSSSGGGAYAWTAQTSGPWLQIDKPSGSGDATLKVSVNPTGLSSGVYNGTVTVSAPGIPGSPQTARVTLTVVSESAGTLARAGGLSHIAAGAGWDTTVSIMNTSSTPATARIVLRTEAGAPWNLPLTITHQGSRTEGTMNTVERTIGANSTLVIAAGAGMSALEVGSAEVLSSGPVEGFAIFRSTGSDGKISEGTVPLQTQFADSMIVPYDNTSGNAMGIAMANMEATTAQITVIAWDESGSPLGLPITIEVAGNGHTSFVLVQKLPLTTGKRGSVQFRAPYGSLAGLGLRFIPYGTFTSVPSILP